MADVLVAGGLGFLGRQIARHYAGLGHGVAGLGHGRATADELAGCGLSQWISGDVTREALANIGAPTLIINAAGSSSVAAAMSAPDLEHDRTLSCAHALLDFSAALAERPKVLMLSSAAVYGYATKLPIREDAPLAPISAYGQAKLEMERLCSHYARQHDIPITILRLFSIYGDGLRKQVFWDACTRFACGDATFAGTGAEMRDWLHVADAVGLVSHAASAASPAVTIMNGGSGASTTVRDALEHLRAAWPTPVAPLHFTGKARAGDPLGYQADINCARSIGWMPRLSLAEGLQKYASWFHTTRQQ